MSWLSLLGLVGKLMVAVKLLKVIERVTDILEFMCAWKLA